MRADFTEGVRTALDAAQSVARDLNQEFVSTEHLLLGLLAGDGDATRVIRAQHVSVPAVRSAALVDLPKGASPTTVTGTLPLSPKAQRVVNGAIVKAQSMREDRISSRFLLLSLMDEPETVVHRSLQSAGADVDALMRSLTTKPAAGEA